jgi:hypothetical protein
MRMLLLLSILGFLFVLANKSPEQGVWDAITGIENKAGEIFTRLKGEQTGMQEDVIENGEIHSPIIVGNEDPPQLDNEDTSPSDEPPTPIKTAKRDPSQVEEPEAKISVARKTSPPEALVGEPHLPLPETEPSLAIEPPVRKVAERVEAPRKPKPLKTEMPKAPPPLPAPQLISERPKHVVPNNPPKRLRTKTPKTPVKFPEPGNGMDLPTDVSPDPEKMRTLKNEEKRIYDRIQKLLNEI